MKIINYKCEVNIKLNYFFICLKCMFRFVKNHVAQLAPPSVSHINDQGSNPPTPMIVTILYNKIKNLHLSIILC